MIPSELLMGVKGAMIGGTPIWKANLGGSVLESQLKDAVFVRERQSPKSGFVESIVGNCEWATAH
jgi:hypothetical protein